MKRVQFQHSPLPYVLIFPQLIIVALFFLYPTVQALLGAFSMTDPFGGRSEFVGFENFQFLFDSPEYWSSFKITLIFSALTCFFSMGLGLFLAVLVNRVTYFSKLWQTIFILPYAIAPAMAGLLWLFLFHPTFGLLGEILRGLGFLWNPVLNGNHALTLVVLAASWKQVSYNFVFYLGALQSLPQSLLDAALVDGANRWVRFWKVIFPLLSPISFFLLVMNLVYAFFDTFGVIHTTTEGGPGGSTSILVYKVYTDGFVGLDLGASATQSVVLMVFALALTILQFKYVEKKVSYAQ